MRGVIQSVCSISYLQYYLHVFNFNQFNMSKVIVIGCIGGSKMALDICKEYPHEEILFYEKSTDVPISESGFKSIVIHKIEMPKLIDLPFMSKAKHEPKGHERPYKYHR